MGIKDIPETLDELEAWSLVRSDYFVFHCAASFSISPPDLLRLSFPFIPCAHSKPDLMHTPQAYEQEIMVPADSNALVARYTVAELLHRVPTFLGLKAAAENIAVSALEERVRIAMKSVHSLHDAQVANLLWSSGSLISRNG